MYVRSKRPPHAPTPLQSSCRALSAESAVSLVREKSNTPMRKDADTDVSLDGTAEKGENALAEGPRVQLSLALSSASLHCQHQSFFSCNSRIVVSPSTPRGPGTSPNVKGSIIVQLQQHAPERAVSFPPLPP